MLGARSTDVTVSIYIFWNTKKITSRYIQVLLNTHLGIDHQMAYSIGYVLWSQQNHGEQAECEGADQLQRGGQVQQGLQGRGQELKQGAGGGWRRGRAGQQQGPHAHRAHGQQQPRWPCTVLDSSRGRGQRLVRLTLLWTLHPLWLSCQELGHHDSLAQHLHSQNILFL